jgi:hypothetical protein
VTSDDRFGWARSDGCLGLTQAVKALRDREARRPDHRDIPPPSVLPATPASREALRLARQWMDPPPRRHRIVNRDGVIVRERPPDNVVPITAARNRR